VAATRVHAAQMWVQQLNVRALEEKEQLQTDIDAIEILMDRQRQEDIRLQPVGPIPPGPWQDAGALHTGCVDPYSNDDQQEYEPSPVSSTGLSWSPSASQSSNGDCYEFGWPVVNEAPPGSEGDDDGSGVEDGTGMDVDEDS